MPEVLVTGATGFIGGRLAGRLRRDGHSVRLLVRDPARLAPDLQGAHIITGDLADMAVLARAVRDVGVIYHCAANVKTWDRREAYQAANVAGVKNLLTAIAAENPGLTRLVHLSTVDVYGFPETPCDERSATPITGFGYGDSKRAGEAVVRELAAAHRIPYTIMRPANVIGPRSQFIERIGRELKSGLMLKIDGGSANAGFIYIDNLVDYLLWAAKADRALGECYNVRDTYDVTWAEFLRAFRKDVKGKGLVVDLPFAAANAAARACEAAYRPFGAAREPLLHRLLVRLFGRTCGHSAGKIRAHSGLSGRAGFEEAMDASLRWFAEQGA